MSGILARIKALFAPPSPAAPAPEADVTAAVPAEQPPAEAPIVLAEASPVMAEEPHIAEDEPLIAEVEPAVAVAERPEEEPERPAAPAPTDGLTLRLESERATQATFHVTKSGATIGRGPESTIQLADLSVSRKHARITFKQGAYWLSDLGSMGGTWIDGTKLAAPRRVTTGQTIDIGLCRLVVAAVEGEATGAAKGPSNAA